MSNIVGTGREIKNDYNTIWLHEDDDVRVAKLEMWIAKNIGEKLATTYPQRQWEVRVDAVARQVIVVCPSLNREHGYHLNMKQDQIDVLIQRSIMAAGEILERHGLSRGKNFNPDVLETLPRDLRDNVLPTEESMLGENPLKT